MAARARRNPKAAAAPPLFQMRGVRLFASGTYRNEDWPPEDIEQIADNAAKLGPSGSRWLVPPSVLGHEEDQTRLAEFLERTDHPAAGWVNPDSVRAVPDEQYPGEMILVGDVVNIPAPVAAELRKGTYRYGSAEIYDDFRDDFGNRHGRVLRRFALLGCEVPQVKRLGPLPPVEPMARPIPFAESRALRVTRIAQGQHTLLFAELIMDRNAMMAAIAAAMPGLSQATLDAMSEEQLADLMKNLPTPTTPADPMGGASAPPAMQATGMFAEGDEEEEPAEPSETETEEGEPDAEEMRAALIDMGQDAAAVDAMEDDEVAAMYDEMMAAQDGQPAATMGDPMAAQTGMMTGAPMPMDPAAPMAEGAASREQMIADLVAMGQDPTALESMTEEQLAAMIAQMAGGAAPPPTSQPATAMSDRRRGKPHVATRSGTVPKANPRRQPQAATFGEREAAQMAANARQLNAQMASEMARLQRRALEDKKARAVRFCEELVADGLFTKAQADLAVLPLLLKLDDAHRVHRHSEGGKTHSLSAFELKCAQLRKAPRVMQFGERVGSRPAPTTEEHEVNRVRKYSETVPESTLRAANTTREAIVSDFVALRKKKPALTAADYLGHAAVS